jgi:CelD/BcsL family acetyltransferase involved in cellulose biosynthesis
MRHARVGRGIGNVRLPAGYEARVVQSAAEWERLRGDWARLAGASPETNVFLSFDVCRLWWRHFGLSHSLLIVLLYRDAARAGDDHRPSRGPTSPPTFGGSDHGGLVGIAPLMIAPERRLGRWLRCLQFIGDNSLSERPDLLHDPAVPEAPAMLWSAVSALRPRWNAALLYEQADGLRAHPFTRALDPDAFVLHQSPPHQAPHVRIGKSWDSYLGDRSPSLRKAFRRKLRRLRECGEVRLLSDIETLDADRALRIYLDVEQRSWKHGARQGIGARPGHVQYYRELLATLAGRGQAQFRALCLDDRPIAATFGLVQDGCFASLEICHDSAFDRFSPGMLLTGLELEELHASGACADYDFLTGTLDNKADWSTDARTTRDLYVLPGDRRGRVDAWVAFRLRPAVKRWLTALGLQRTAVSVMDRLRRRDG